MLLGECDRAGVTIMTRCDVEDVSQNTQWQVATSKGLFSGESLVVATGGLSIPSLGGSGLGYELASRFGLQVLPRRAGLVPFTFTDSFRELSERLTGLSLPVAISTARQTFVDDILFTHRGLSGPAVLQLSSYWQEGQVITLDLLPGKNADELFRQARQNQPKTLLRTFLAGYLPRKLVLELQALWWPELADTPLAEIADKRLRDIAGKLSAWQLKPAGTEGYRTAEVTLGGIDTNELSSRTMECKSHPGLYFIGEVVDVSGHLGGFNFQWAWSSGHVAGEVV